jgi:hypothetical protein
MTTQVSTSMPIHLRVASDTFANETQFIDQLDMLMRGVDVEFVYIPDYWPFVDSRGEWAGALAAVRNGIVDTLYETLYVSPDRQSAFAFTNPIIQTEYAVVYAHEPPAMLHFENLSADIDYSVYLLIAVTSFTLILLNQLVEHIIPAQAHTSDVRNDYTLAHCFIAPPYNPDFDLSPMKLGAGGRQLQ